MMEKVRCCACGSVGYTASPQCVSCSECGGRHEIINMRKSDLKIDTKSLNAFLRGITGNGSCPSISKSRIRKKISMRLKDV